MIPMVQMKQLADLKKMASVNLESALLAAVRLGAMKSSTPEKPIKRAAAIIEYEAESIRASHTVAGNWGNSTEAKREHDEYKRVAKSLRALLTPEEGK